MSIAQLEFHHIALVRDAVTYTYKLHFFLVALGYTYYHRIDERTVKTVECLLLLGINSIILLVDGKCYMSVFYVYNDRRIDLLCKLTLRTFYGHYIILCRHGDARGDVNRQFTYS